MVNFLGTLQNEWAGAQAFNNVDTYLAPFVRHTTLIDFLRQKARPNLFSSAMTVPDVAANLAAVEIMEESDERVTRL